MRRGLDFSGYSIIPGNICDTIDLRQLSFCFRALSYEPTNSESVYTLVTDLHIAGPTITPALLTLHVIHELKIRYRWNMHNRCKLSKIVNFFQILLSQCRRHRFGKFRFLLTDSARYRWIECWCWFKTGGVKRRRTVKVMLHGTIRNDDF